MRSKTLGSLVVLVALGLGSCAPHAAAPQRLGGAGRSGVRHGPPAGPADPRTTLRVHFIDVGQADAVLLEFPCAAMLVDLGAEKNRAFDGVQALRSYLTEFFDRRPDLNHTIQLLAVTHPHIDHVRGVGLLLSPNSPFKVANIITNGLESSSGGRQQKRLHAWAEAQGVPLQKISLADVPPKLGLTSPIIDPIQCEAVDPEIRVLFSTPDAQPDDWRTADFENVNNRSMVVRVDFGDTSLLLMADLEEKGISTLLELMADSPLLDADVLKVGHHGSWNATNTDLLDAVTPDLAVIMMGPSDREVAWSAWAYGHPRRDTVEMLVEAVTLSRTPAVEVPVATKAKQFELMRIGKAVYGTGWDGTVVIEAGTTGKARRVE